ncbi:MAG: DUF4142 domain-containing protein [Candidatus Eremiobacteraeota bacterium]|nr:DUF4142 domain-containing protein [Candidatus Eremiobacteraeota bacterium]
MKPTRGAVLALAAGLLMGVPALAKSEAPMMPMSTMRSADAMFVRKAAQGGLAEVMAGGLAQQRGASSAVRMFGARMVRDHGRANRELMQLADASNMRVPKMTDAMHRMLMMKMQSLHGAAFDAAYARAQIDDHNATIALFQQEASSGRNAQLRSFAQRTLPTLQRHLAMAQMLRR